MAQPQRPMVIVEDGTLQAMANDNRFVAILPSLRQLRPRTAVRRGCGGCQRSALAQARRQNYQAVRQALAGLDATRKQAIRQLLNANRVRVIVRDSNGKVVNFDF